MRAPVILLLTFVVIAEAARWPFGSRDNPEGTSAGAEHPDLTSRAIGGLSGISAETAQKLRKMISLPEIYNHVYNRVSEEVTDFKSADPYHVRAVVKSAVTEKLDEQLHRDTCPVKLPWYTSLGRDSCHIIAQRIGNQVGDSMADNLRKATDLLGRGFTVYQTLAQTTADYGRKAAQKVKQTGEAMKLKSEEGYEYVKQKGTDTADTVRSGVHRTGEAIASTGQAARDTAVEGAQWTKEKALGGIETVKAKAKQAGDTVASGVEYTKEKTKQGAQAVADTASRTGQKLKQRTGQVVGATGEALSETGEAISSTGKQAADSIRSIVYGGHADDFDSAESGWGERYGIATVQRYIITFVEAVLPRIMYEQLTAALKVPEEDMDQSLLSGPFDFLDGPGALPEDGEPTGEVEYGRPREPPSGFEQGLNDLTEQFQKFGSRLFGLEVFALVLMGTLWFAVPFLAYLYWNTRKRLAVYESEFALKPREEQASIFQRLDSEMTRDSFSA